MSHTCYGRMYNEEAMSCRTCSDTDRCKELTFASSPNRYTSSFSRRVPTSVGAYEGTYRTGTLPAPQPRINPPTEGETKIQRFGKNTLLAVLEMFIAQAYLFVKELEW